MRLIDIVNGPWAITTDMLHEIRSIYAKHLRGEKIDIERFKAENCGGFGLDRKQGYDNVNGAAVIQIEGVLAKKMNLFMNISGGASTQLIERDIRAALDDPAVEKIVLNIDSPGGTIDGTFELANFIYGARGKKPIIAFTDGMMASAAYAIAAAADRIYISGDTTRVGSIGVVAAHEDISKFEEKIGVKTSEIYSGKFKRITSQYAPLSDEGRKTMQDTVDYMYSVFVASVAKHRGVTEEDVLSRMSTDVKCLFIGVQAIEAGLVDGVSTLPALIAGTASGGVPGGEAKSKTKPKEGFMAKAEEDKDKPVCPKCGKEMKCPDCDKAPEEKIPEEKVKLAFIEGAKAGLERIQGVFSCYRPGREDIVKAAMFDGVATKETVAAKILDAEDAKRETLLAGLKEDGKAVKLGVVDGLADEAAGAPKGKGKGKDFPAQVEAYKEEKQCSQGEAVKAIAKADPDAHAKWVAGLGKK